jgi:hypothetical protein
MSFCSFGNKLLMTGLIGKAMTRAKKGRPLRPGARPADEQELIPTEWHLCLVFSVFRKKSHNFQDLFRE